MNMPIDNNELIILLNIFRFFVVVVFISMEISNRSIASTRIENGFFGFSNGMA